MDILETTMRAMMIDAIRDRCGVLDSLPLDNANTEDLGHIYNAVCVSTDRIERALRHTTKQGG
jgi:uncharacterized protein YfkK (UPF0435 family)